MTRCNKDESSLKSTGTLLPSDRSLARILSTLFSPCALTSVQIFAGLKSKSRFHNTAYNQTGENFFAQLSAYNSMSSHLRRVLLARSVVDARNQGHLPKRRRAGKSADRTLNRAIPRDVIDRLAYDTRHHPADVIRASLDARYPCQRGEKCRVDRYRSRSRSRRVFTERSNSGSRKMKCADDEGDIQTEDRSEGDSPRSDSISDFMINETVGLSALSYSRSYEEDNGEQTARANGRVGTDECEEDARYAEFVYGITREIMRNGLYTDEELQDVFKKHLDRHRGVLNMSKMLYEIYQLKVTLNVSDDSDVDEELEDLIHAQRLLSVSEMRPPTPPKILDENKVIEKLMSYQRVAADRSSVGRNKSVRLVDANPELLVTERDVLTSLMEADIDPNQAQQICKSLFHKSRDTFVTDAVQAEANRANERLAENEDGPDVDPDSADSHFKESSGMQEKCCTTSDLVAREDKNVQAHV